MRSHRQEPHELRAQGMAAPRRRATFDIVPLTISVLGLLLSARLFFGDRTASPAP